MKNQKKPKNIAPLSAELFSKRTFTMLDMMNEFKKKLSEHHVYISKGNNKTGDLVPSVSLIPGYSCHNCSKCAPLCYDMRTDCMYPTVQRTRAINQAIAEGDPERYFREISEFCKDQEFFRWHVGGDILSWYYLLGIVTVAKKNPQCSFLIFTKMYGLVNDYVAEGHKIPDNLKIVFSAWVGMAMDNPYNFPTSNPLFFDGSATAHDGAKYCSGNCSECAVKKNGCFDLKPGEEVIFLAH